MNSTSTKRFRMIRGGRAALEWQAVCAALFDLPDAESLARRLKVSANSVVRVAWSGSPREDPALSGTDCSGRGKVEGPLMDRYVFYHSDLHDKNAVTFGKKMAVSLGATVVRTALGSMLLEASPSTIALVAEALPEWRWCRETMAHRIPEAGRRPRSSE